MGSHKAPSWILGASSRRKGDGEGIGEKKKKRGSKDRNLGGLDFHNVWDVG